MADAKQSGGDNASQQELHNTLSMQETHMMIYHDTMQTPKFLKFRAHGGQH